MKLEDDLIGTRIRKIRHWRGMTASSVAGLARISRSYLSRIELGNRAVSSRSVLEAIAKALRVAPSALTTDPHQTIRRNDVPGHDALQSVDAALTDWWPGELPEDTAPRPVTELADAVRRLNTLRHACDYPAMANLVPGLTRELLVHYASGPHRRQAGHWLVDVYQACMYAAKSLYGVGLLALAYGHVERIADDLEDVQLRGVSYWMRGQAFGPGRRARQATYSARAAADLEPHIGEPGVLEAYGQVHLNAALGAVASGQPDLGEAHLREARDAAARVPGDGSPWAGLWFGPTNVAIWDLVLAGERRDVGRVERIGPTVHIDAVPYPGRKAEFYMEWGRALVSERRSRDRGLSLILKAEKLAPHRVRNHPLVRDAVGSLIVQARKDAGGGELPGLAMRMGIAP
ncbi:helix-turn-helix domain-containing protein [Actinoalloteichus caeruleus]|uniref:helix-turn-helix domain-containing protein n=2 Tax=Actinoalloteichus cyanogriseus TaxID=2893586 RepID=UPI0009DE713F|nr:helix-turn-helix transcriptional regulator [Actinoalloteichus caeruleus]